MCRAMPRDVVGLMLGNRAILPTQPNPSIEPSHAGVADLGICSSDSDVKGLHSVLYRQDKLVVLMLPDHPLGTQGITLADTTGMANPRQVDRLVRRVLQRVSPADLTLHCHNTRGLGLCNVLVAYEAGARRFDAALGGLGGCPFAPGASGNICTEDLVNLCDEIGIHSGIDLPQFLQLSRGLPALLGQEVPGQLGAGIFANHTTFLIVALGLLGSGIIASIPSFWTLPPKLLAGADAGAAGGIAVIITLGQFGGIVSPVMVGRIKDLTGSTTPALYVIGVAALIVAALLMWGLPQKLRTLDKF